MMGCPHLFRTCFAFFNLFFFCCCSFALSNNASDGYYMQELDALLALKAMLNDPFLNRNWTGICCSEGVLPPWYGIECDSGHVTGIMLQSMGLNGKVNGDALMELPELTVISFRNNSISGNVMNFSSNQKLKDIDLSANNLDGPISTSLLSVVFLESLQLQDNKLTGPVLDFNQSSLKVFNVSDNNLSGPIPNTPTLQSFGRDSYSNNLELCGPPLPNACNVSNDTEKKTTSKSHTVPVMIVLVLVVGSVGVVLLFILYFRKARKPKRIKKEEDSEKVSEEEVEEEEETIERQVMDMGKQKVIRDQEEMGKLMFMEDEAAGFQLNDLLKASAEGLGKGIFGNSYKAKLQGRAAVVVKRLRDLKPMSNEEFRNQLFIIANLKHPNLLPLLAYYYSKEEKLLVYKYAENGNLFNRLHGNARGGTSNKDRIPFRWNSRLSVARAVARALEYLHLSTKSQSVVPHGNLKLSNILLDENDKVLVSDYGLTSLVAHPIAVQRMVSYKSPEYQTAKRVSRKSDVWTFGCLLLELLTGRISVHSAPPGIKGVDLTSWVLRAVREEWTAEIFDTQISVQKRECHSMLNVLRIAIQCCDKSPEKRPEMTEVVRELENIKVVESEDEEDFSLEQSLTDESLSTNASR